MDSRDKIQNVVTTVERRTWARPHADSNTQFTHPIEGAMQKYEVLREGMNSQISENLADGVGSLGENSGNE